MLRRALSAMRASAVPYIAFSAHRSGEASNEGPPAHDPRPSFDPKGNCFDRPAFLTAYYSGS